MVLPGAPKNFQQLMASNTHCPISKEYMSLRKCLKGFRFCKTKTHQVEKNQRNKFLEIFQAISKSNSTSFASLDNISIRFPKSFLLISARYEKHSIQFLVNYEPQKFLEHIMFFRILRAIQKWINF